MTKQNDIIDYLSFIYNSTYMPLHYYRDETLISIYPSWALPLEKIDIYRNSIVNRDVNLDYFSTDESLYIGIVSNSATNESIILGPVSTAAISHSTLEKIVAKYNLPNDNYIQIQEYYQRTPQFSLSQILNIMALINKELNHETVDIFKRFNEVNFTKENTVGKNHSTALIERKENEKYHDTYYFEQELYGYVERGDVVGIKSFYKAVPSFTEGTIAADSIRQAKNIFITTIALVTRKAISGGLDIETAYQLSDSYIQEVEKMSDSASITLLIGTSIIDFTKRVAEAKIPIDMTQEIFHCIQYISNHVNQKLTVEEIADHLNMDRSTLSKKFKRELGFNISTYIMRRKLEEAKSLLRYTDQTISEISEYLCFSTQSYFQNVFKKKYGMTPKEFRDSI